MYLGVIFEQISVDSLMGELHRALQRPRAVRARRVPLVVVLGLHLRLDVGFGLDLGLDFGLDFGLGFGLRLGRRELRLRLLADEAENR